ncbi:uncharacterized protein LOC5580039 [Aedes aegypti]|nr:uncharacterized protein LOC5580039 [Aedes aegypti]AAS22239.1 putative 8.7 kDa secreted protein [Aedes aegypti]
MKSIFAFASIAMLLMICTIVVSFPVPQNATEGGNGGMPDISKMNVNLGDLADPSKMKAAVDDVVKKIQSGISQGMQSMPKFPQ